VLPQLWRVDVQKKKKMNDNEQYDLIFRKSKRIMLFGIPILGFLLTFPMNHNKYVLFTFEHLIHTIISIIVTSVFWLSCMFTVKKLWKKYPWHIKPIQHISIEILLIITISLALISIPTIAFVFFGEPFVLLDFLYNFIIVTLVSLFIITFHEAYFFYYQWKLNFNKSAVLEKDNVIAKYETLKNQINPHFLFNSLNTLQTCLDDNPDASKYVQNLSDFLRYTLKTKDADIKLLRDEIKIVEKYYFLQKSRFGNNLTININVEDKFYHYSLPPLSLQILVENAIKHNIISKQKPLTINVFIKNNEYLVVENNLQRKIDVDSTKIGIFNIKNRYKFLSEKEIKIKQQNDKFIVELPLLQICNIWF